MAMLVSITDSPCLHLPCGVEVSWCCGWLRSREALSALQTRVDNLLCCCPPAPAAVSCCATDI